MVIQQLATVGEIARRLGVPVHRVEYVLRSRPDIKPHGVAGAVRCFDEPSVAAIEDVLSSISEKRKSHFASHGVRK